MMDVKGGSRYGIDTSKDSSPSTCVLSTLSLALPLT